jgi:choline dehydrogenase-like flavoprotein
MSEPIDSYDLILVGTSFASSFFLMEYARRAPRHRVLVLERGPMLTHAEHGDRQYELEQESRGMYVNATPWKPWVFRVAFGGSSNCWAACTPRLTPEDFQMRTRYGVGVDWPITYDELERYYCDAEDAMAISGPLDGGRWPRSRPYPQPPHRFSDPDRLLRKADPGLWFEQPSARPTRQTASGRAVCCATGVCHQCPIDSKFTVLNELKHLYDAEGVELRVGARVTEVEHAGGIATGVRWIEGGREMRANGALVGLGANAIFNPHLLLRSGLDGPEVGKGLVEQASMWVELDLNGVDGFGGSTLITALGYPLYDGPHRAVRAGALIESRNAPVSLRDVRNRWRQYLALKVIFEDLRQPQNAVTLSAEDPDRPRVVFVSHSSYTQAGIASLPDVMPHVVRALPVEDMRFIPEPTRTEAHVQCTTPMGADPATSVVDRDLRHHRLRNLLVLGASVFPTCPPGNPTLTLSALSLRAAERLFA